MNDPAENTLPLPVVAPFDLGKLSQAGAECVLTPSETERAAIARFLDIEKIDAFRAEATLERAGETYVYRGRLTADIVQACVVTLAPVPAHIQCDAERRYRMAPKLSRKVKIEDISPADDDEPELLEGSAIDLYAPILEELALSLDPYPRAPGAEFAAPVDEDPPESPFAVLKKLKESKS